MSALLLRRCALCECTSYSMLDMLAAGGCHVTRSAMQTALSDLIKSRAPGGGISWTGLRRGRRLRLDVEDGRAGLQQGGLLVARPHQQVREGRPRLRPAVRRPRRQHARVPAARELGGAVPGWLSAKHRCRAGGPGHSHAAAAGAKASRAGRCARRRRAAHQARLPAGQVRLAHCHCGPTPSQHVTGSLSNGLRRRIAMLLYLTEATAVQAMCWAFTSA